VGVGVEKASSFFFLLSLPGQVDCAFLAFVIGSCVCYFPSFSFVVIFLPYHNGFVVNGAWGVFNDRVQRRT